MAVFDLVLGIATAWCGKIPFRFWASRRCLWPDKRDAATQPLSLPLPQAFMQGARRRSVPQQ